MALAVVGVHTLCHISWTYSSLLQAEMAPCCYRRWSRVCVGNHEMEFVIKMHEKPASHTTPVPLKSVSTGQMAKIYPHLHVNFIALCPCPCKWSRRGGHVGFISRLHLFLCFSIPAHASIKQQYDSSFIVNVTLKGWSLSVSSVFIVYARNSADVKDPLKSKWETCL